MRGTRAVRRMAVAALVATAIGACAAPHATTTVVAPPPAPAPPTAIGPVPTLHGQHDYAAVVRASADVRAEPSAEATSVGTFPDHNENGAPQTFLIDGERAVGPADTVWYHVLLPVRPNGTTGWVRATEVEVVGLRYRLEVRLRDFRLDVLDGDHLVRSIAIGVGADQTPTPGGRYYLKELLRPPDQSTLYGTYVFGLNGFSNVLVDWPGGGVLGIHGTNDPASIGTKASHGCVRMRNEDIEYLAGLLPLGTPVTVSA